MTRKEKENNIWRRIVITNNESRVIHITDHPTLIM